MPGNIELLDHTDGDVADAIYSLFQESYRAEAELIGANDFPPLRRSSNNIALSNSSFWGRQNLNGLVGIIEIEQEPALLQISSLVVSPRQFRQGIGTSLVTYILSVLKWQQAQVQTATANAPAIRLYQNTGFIEQKRWLSKQGIELVLLSKSNTL